MKASSVLRVFFALFLSVSALTSAVISTPDVTAQDANEFVMDAHRMCEGDLVLRWDSTNVDTIEFTATNTSRNWTTGWLEVDDVQSKIHTEFVGEPFDKVSVEVTYHDGSGEDLSQNIGPCVENITTPPPTLDGEPNPIVFEGTVVDLMNQPLPGAEVCINGKCTTTDADGTYTVSFDDRGTGDFTAMVTAEGFDASGVGLGLDADTESPYQLDLRAAFHFIKDCDRCAYDPNVVTEMCVVEDGVKTTVDYRAGDLHVQRLAYYEFDGDDLVLKLTDRGAAMMTIGPCAAEPDPTPGGGAQAPVPTNEGSFNDPVSGNSFSFMSAVRACEDNSLRVTWTGTNIDDLMFTAYSPANGWGTDWLQADITSNTFTAEIERDTAYLVDAAVYFENGDIEKVYVDIPECTPSTVAGDEIPDAGIGENDLRVQFNLPSGMDLTGDPYSLFASQAAAQAVAAPYLSGFVGTNNTVAINGLIPGQYRLVVYPEGQDPIEALITVGDQPVTEATVTVNADGTTTVAYATQQEGEPDPDATDTPAGTESSTTGDSTVSGLPSTGSGSVSAGLLSLASAALVLLGGAAMITRFGIVKR